MTVEETRRGCAAIGSGHPRRAGIRLDVRVFLSAGERNRQRSRPPAAQRSVETRVFPRGTNFAVFARCAGDCSASASPVHTRPQRGLTVNRVVRSWLFVVLALVVGQATMSAQAEVSSTSGREAPPPV